jgi:hypothetical protein
MKSWTRSASNDSGESGRHVDTDASFFPLPSHYKPYLASRTTFPSYHALCLPVMSALP